MSRHKLLRANSGNKGPSATIRLQRRKHLESCANVVGGDTGYMPLEVQLARKRRCTIAPRGLEHGVYVHGLG